MHIPSWAVGEYRLLLTLTKISYKKVLLLLIEAWIPLHTAFREVVCPFSLHVESCLLLQAHIFEVHHAYVRT